MRLGQLDSQPERNEPLLAGQQASTPKDRFRLPHAYAVLVEIEALIKHIFDFCRSSAATPLQWMIPIALGTTFILRVFYAELMNQFCSEVYNNATDSTEMSVNDTAVNEALNQPWGAIVLTLEAPGYCSNSELVTAMTMFFGIHTVGSLLQYFVMGLHKGYTYCRKREQATSEAKEQKSLPGKLWETLCHEMKPSTDYSSGAFINQIVRPLLIASVLAVIIARMTQQPNDNESPEEPSYIHLIPFASGVEDAIKLLTEGIKVSPARWVSFVALFPPIWLKLVEILLLNMARAELQDTSVPSILRRQIWNQVLGDVILSSSLMPTSLLDKMGAMSLLGMSVANYLVGSGAICLISAVPVLILKCCGESNTPVKGFFKGMIKIHNPWPGCAFPLDMLKFTTNAAIYVAAHALFYGLLCPLLLLPRLSCFAESESYRRGCDTALRKLGARSFFVNPQSSFSRISLVNELRASEGSEWKQFLLHLRLLSLNARQKAINPESGDTVDIVAVINEVKIISLALEDNLKNNPREIKEEDLQSLLRDGLLGELEQHYNELFQGWRSKNEALSSRDNHGGEGLTSSGSGAV